MPEQHERAGRDQQAVEGRELAGNGGAQMQRGEAASQSDQLRGALLPELPAEGLGVDAPVGKSAQSAARQVGLCRPGDHHADQAEGDRAVGPAPKSLLLWSSPQDEGQEEGEPGGHQHA